MRVFNQIVFDDFVVGTTTVYTDASWNALLGLTELVTIQAVVDQVTATPSITIAQEHSGDNRNFVQKATTAEISNKALTANQTYVFIAGDGGLTPSAAYVRLSIALTGNQAHVRITVTGRVHGDNPGAK